MKRDQQQAGGGILPSFCFYIRDDRCFTCISVTMGAVEIAPVNIVKIIINKSFGR